MLDNNINNEFSILEIYRNILNNSNDIILLISNNGNIINANRAAINTYGYTESELLTMNVFDLRNQNKLDIVKSQFNTAQKEGIQFQTFHYRKDGSKFPVEVKSSSLEIDNEKFVLSIINDISYKLKKEEEIRQLASIVENSEDAIIGKTLEGIIISWNKGAEKLYGYTKEEIIGKSISIIIPEGVDAEFSKILNDFKNGLKVERYERVRKNRNNNLVYVFTSISHIYDIDGNLIGTASIERDISEKKEYMKKIEKLSVALEQSASIALITDICANIEYVNKKFEEITGYKKNEILGKNIKLLDSGLQDKDFYRDMWECIKNGKSWTGDICNKKKYGDIFWWTISVSPIKNNRFEITGFLAVAEDITEKKQLLENLNKKNIELEDALKLVKETQMKLIQEDKMASIGQLSAGIAHEINNPLGFVSSNFNTLKKYVKVFEKFILEYKKFKSEIEQKSITSIEEELKSLYEIEKSCKFDYILDDTTELFEDTEDGLTRIKNIVNALKNFSRANIDDNFEDYNVNEGIMNTLTIARNEIKYSAEIKTNLDEIPFIKAKSSEINQVILNMIINSSHAVKEKLNQNKNYSGEITLSTYSDEKFVYCSIEDNGTGIPEKNLDKIFNPFFTTKPVGSGTGLGLSISYDIIVNKHKGDLKVESKLGEGTKITIILPINQEQGD